MSPRPQKRKTSKTNSTTTLCKKRVRLPATESKIILVLLQAGGLLRPVSLAEEMLLGDAPVRL
jgi:hypothetical protein